MQDVNFDSLAFNYVANNKIEASPYKKSNRYDLHSSSSSDEISILDGVNESPSVKRLDG